MGVFKCNVGLVWVLVVSGLLPFVSSINEQPAESPAPLIAAMDVPKIEVVEGTIRKNTTLVATLVDADVPVALANDLADLIKPVFDVRKMRFGNLFRVEKETDGTLRAFEYKIDDESVLKVQKEAASYAASVEKLRFDSKEAAVTAEIDTSLWNALGNYPDREYLSDEIAKIFAWDVDFNTEIQPGDKVRLIVSEQYSDGKFVKYGPIQAAELVNSGRTFTAYLFKDAYYDSKGNAVKRAWLASPLPFTRVTSGFTTRRMHPILGNVRAHLAVDYGAPTGTPVQAVANGTIISAGTNGGYGRLVQIRHANGLTTGYAHLSRIAAGIRPGVAVKQGQLIGAVGQSGLATGPHLHYMMTRGGKAIDPRSIKSEPPVPMPANLKQEFLTYVAAEQLRFGTLVATR
jgi:murein DD-endopeptidase MepM/ murein hydrolase activator NlpD